MGGIFPRSFPLPCRHYCMLTRCVQRSSDCSSAAFKSLAIDRRVRGFPRIPKRTFGSEGQGFFETPMHGHDRVTEGVWIYHRHGDRTPGNPSLLVKEDLLNGAAQPHPGGSEMNADNMSAAPQMAAEMHSIAKQEHEFWISRVPPEPLENVFFLLCQHHPVRMDYRSVEAHDVSSSTQMEEILGSFHDVDKFPYGYLTIKGARQLLHLGRRLSLQYSGNDRDDSFFEQWNVRSYSTTYLRTVMSAQFLLRGMSLPTSSSLMTPSEGQSVGCAYNALLTAIQEPDVSSTGTTSQSLLPAVFIRTPKDDTLNPFDSRPEVLSKLSREVILSEEFQTYDRDVGYPLAQELALFLPGLCRSASPTRGPSGKNWIQAADYFHCRNSHAIPLRPTFGDFFQNHKGNPDSTADQDVENRLKALSNSTMRHLAWRFRQYYHHEVLVSFMVGPALKELLDDIRATIASSSAKNNSMPQAPSSRRPFVTHSCHDVTLLSLLYGLRANFLFREDKDEGGSSYEASDWHFWPEYASYLSFELLRVNRPGPSSSSSRDETSAKDTGEGQWRTEMDYRVRILLNGNPLPIEVGSTKSATHIIQQQGEKSAQHTITIAQLAEIVDQWEQIRMSYEEK